MKRSATSRSAIPLWSIGRSMRSLWFLWFSTFALGQDRPPPLQAQQTHDIGEEVHRVGPPEVEFAGITDVAIDGAGTLWIADGPTGRVILVRGGSRLTVATGGEGPGQLAPGAIELVVLPGDTMLVVQPHAGKFSRFDSAGRHIDDIRIGPVEGLTSGWQTSGPGELIARVNRQTMMPAQASETARDPLMKFGTDGSVRRSAVSLAPSHSFRMGPGGRPLIVLLAAQPVWTVAPDGLVLTASTDAYLIELVGPDGSAASILRDAQREPVTPKLANRARDLLRETLHTRRLPPQMIDQLAAAAEVGTTAPVIGGVLAGPEKTIWVQLGATSADELLDLERPGGRRWDVLNREGATRGQVVLPARFQALGFRGRALYGISHDELGRTSVVVYSIEAAGEAQ